MNSFFSSKNILDILLKWKYHLAAILVITVVLSVIFSGPAFITPLYKSTAIMYPSNIAPYSDENETEQMAQIMDSRDIRDSIIRKFDLAKHWKLDSNDVHFMSTMDWYWQQRVKVGKTPYEAVSIEVKDPNPAMACDIVLAMMDYYNSKVRSLQQGKFKEVVRNFEEIDQVIRKDLDSLSVLSAELGTKYGLMDYQAQTREVMRGLLGTGGSARMAEVQKYKKALEEKGGQMQLIQDLMTAQSEGYSLFKLDYNRALLDYNRPYTYINLLSQPYPADKKASPIRWLIVVLSVFAVLTITIITIGIIERSRMSRIHPND
jgi:capsular polysaccharide biosynthesis protein